ncbi:FAD-binding protein [Herbiconiux sp. VKM Ac-2851]|uniref:FAD-binding protein n=1 Tax=Herbiconiux sp. VKM Ac-2851 TaxID=2739025 RepID=UPI0015641C67|nr:FAD-binding protein [Herbiconiux sp. VKM Ac-2851]NQX35433.1 FAD-binding protein [Herbiconiux sp. VKM Ac-2851]
MSAVGPNWAGSYEYGASALLRPSSLDELVSLLQSSPRLRALGSRHSFNDVADSPGVLVSVDALFGDEEPVLSESDRTVTVGAATRFAALAAFLEPRGWALHNLGSLPHISIGGAIATGTHGSGVGNGSLSTAVAALEYVDGAGSLVRIARGDEGFEGSVVALGALGIVTQVTLDIQPSYQVRQDIFVDLSWEAALDGFDEIMAAAYSVSLFGDWGDAGFKQAWVKTRLDGVGSGAGSTSATPASSTASAPFAYADSFFGARPAGSKVMSPAGDDLDNTTVQGGVPGPWSERLPHFRADVTPSAGDEIQTEYFVSRADARAALLAVRALGDRLRPHLLVTELRTIAADALWLSPVFGRDSLAIHFTWKSHPTEVRELLPSLEAALAPFDVRPHWGKWFTLDAAELAPKYEHLADFAALAESRDPAHRFRNPYLARVLGLPA